MNYGLHLVHCFARRDDFGILSEGTLSEANIKYYLSQYNNTNGYGHSNKAVIGYKCNVLYDDEMKIQEFVNELNNLVTAGSSGENEEVVQEEKQNVWKMDTKSINNGYPIFMWQ